MRVSLVATRRLRSMGTLAFWAVVAPVLFFTLLPVVLAPLVLLGPCAQETKPAQMFALAAVISVGLVVWWVWRIHQGDPPRDPHIPSKKVLVGTSLVIAWMVVTIAMAPQQGTLVDRPWLAAPIFIDYPCEARRASIEGAVRFDLIIEESGVISSYEIHESPDPSFTRAVEAAIDSFRVNTRSLDADSFPYRKQLKIQFELSD